MKTYITVNAFILALFLTVTGIIAHYTSEDISVMSTAQSVGLPIIMYHGVLRDTDLSGKYVVTPSQIENDIEYLISRGYTTVSMDEVISFTEGGNLPDKPVMLTFDDGCYNNYGYVLPILEKYGAHAIFCIVGEYTDRYTDENISNMTYGYMRWSEICELIKNPHAEVANHSYGFHSNINGRNGSKKNPGESAEEYRRVFLADTEKAQSRFAEHCGFEPYIYAYPFGAYSEDSFDILKVLGFKATLSCNEGINEITRGSDCLYLLKRYNRPSGISSADFFKNLNI